MIQLYTLKYYSDIEVPTFLRNVFFLFFLLLLFARCLEVRINVQNGFFPTKIILITRGKKRWRHRARADERFECAVKKSSGLRRVRANTCRTWPSDTSAGHACTPAATWRSLSETYAYSEKRDTRRSSDEYNVYSWRGEKIKKIKKIKPLIFFITTRVPGDNDGQVPTRPGRKFSDSFLSRACVIIRRGAARKVRVDRSVVKSVESYFF